jgi:hypothetical protein
MKKLFTLLALGVSVIATCQTKSSGVVNLGTSMTMKIDLNKATSIATLTITGPSNVWFAVALNAVNMASKDADCIMINGTDVLDRALSGKRSQPITDDTNNYTVVSNKTAGTVRTVVLTRPYDTKDAKDYVFTNALTTLKVIWGYGRDTNIAKEHAKDGKSTVNFTDSLGLDDFASNGKINMYPNPAPSGKFTIYKDNDVEINKVRVFDINAKLLKEVNINENKQEIPVDLSTLSKGTYFIEISNNEDQAVRKIFIE